MIPSGEGKNLLLPSFVRERGVFKNLLGNKAGLDLTGYRKLYVDKQRIRIVYRVDDDLLIVMIVAVEKRDDLQIYTGG